MPLLAIGSSDNRYGASSMVKSETICRYLLFKYISLGLSLLPNNVKSNLITHLYNTVHFIALS